MPISRRRFGMSVAGSLGALALTSSLSGCRRVLRMIRDRNVRSEPSTPRSAPKNVAVLGINLSAADDWNSELPFVDVFRLARPWSSQQEGVEYGKGPTLAVDENGWVKSLPAGAWAEAVLCGAPRPPEGEWTVLYEGKGKIEMWAPAISGQTERAPGHLTFQVSAGDNEAFFLRLRATDPSDPVRNIRVIMPGHADTYREEPYNPRFLARWRGVAAVRFMDLMKTNDSPQARWVDRPRVDHATWAERGVPAEVLCDIANRLEADPWFCMPHKADDDYVQKFGAVVKGKLAPQRKVYVEYSNEVWNGQFAQAHFAEERGGAQGIEGGSFERQVRFYTTRAREVFAAFERGLGGRERLVRVLAAQSGNVQVAEQVLGYDGAGEAADALAIAPYLGFNVSQAGDEPTVNTVHGYTLDRLFDVLQQEVLPAVQKQIAEHRALADKFGLALVAYEGGQHLVGVQGGENDARVTELLTSANRDARMGALYTRYYEAWKGAGGGLFCHFSSVTRSSKWGSWGLLEHDADDETKAPKFQATMAWARALGQKVGA